MPGPPQANVWLERTAFNWAHQGGAREGPSNTLHAMRKAVAAGADGVELDVHRTIDGELVVIHDDTTDRTTDEKGNVAEHTLADLRNRDAAYWWVPGQVVDHHAPVESYVLRGQGPADPDLRLPTLGEVVDALDVPLTIELKTMAAVEPVVELLRHRAVPDGRVIVTSMSDATVRRLRALAPELPLAPGRYWTIWFLVRTRLRVPPRRAPYVAIQVPHRHEWGATVFSGRLGPLARRLPTWLRSVRVIDPRFVRAAHRARMAVHAWTIDDEAEMGQLLGMGVDGLMTDRPSVLAALLRGQPGPDERKAP